MSLVFLGCIVNSSYLPFGVSSVALYSQVSPSNNGTPSTGVSKLGGNKVMGGGAGAAVVGGGSVVVGGGSVGATKGSSSPYDFSNRWPA